MKKILLLSLTILLITSASESQILLDENFNYTIGDSLGAHGWVSFSGGNTNVLTVTAPGLVYSGYVLSNIGFSTRVRNNGQDAYRQFTPDSSTSVYCSFMVRVDSALTGDYFLALLPNSSTTNYTGRVYIKDTTGGVKFGVSKSTNPIVYTTPTYSYSITYLIVLKYTFLSGGAQDDEVRLYVITGGIPGTEPAPTIGPITQAINDAPHIARVALRQGLATSSPTIMLDGIRVSKTWGNLVGIQPISNVATEFSLSQNYPNPFNPNTVISFQLAVNTFASLKVYDLLGREVAKLVNEKLQPGTYEVNFDGTNYPSGVYFYTIEAGNFKESKKMILIK